VHIEAALKQAMTTDGAVGACLVDWDSGSRSASSAEENAWTWTWRPPGTPKSSGPRCAPSSRCAWMTRSRASSSPGQLAPTWPTRANLANSQRPGQFAGGPAESPPGRPDRAGSPNSGAKPGHICRSRISCISGAATADTPRSMRPDNAAPTAPPAQTARQDAPQPARRTHRTEPGRRDSPSGANRPADEPHATRPAGRTARKTGRGPHLPGAAVLKRLQLPDVHWHDGSR
jgi:hypothetical protein